MTRQRVENTSVIPNVSGSCDAQVVVLQQVVGGAVSRIEVFVVTWVALRVHLGEGRGAVGHDVGVAPLSLVVVVHSVVGLIQIIVHSYRHAWVGTPDSVSIEGEVVLGERLLRKESANCKDLHGVSGPYLVYGLKVPAV